jgi:sialate O-acetylesterase
MGKSFWAALAVLLAGAAEAQNAPLLYANFQDHEVLQRDKPIPVWGTDEPGAKVTVTVASESASAVADAAGKWQAVLAPLKAGGPYDLEAASTSGRLQVISDVMIGDVYLCSGQSNMEFPTEFASGYTNDLDGATNTMIRLFHVERFASVTPRDSYGAGASWAVTSPQTVRDFSAVCYFFGRALQPKLNVPVGLVESSWGGTMITAWIGADEVRALGTYQPELDAMAHYATDPEAAKKAWLQFIDGWWQAHDPASATSPAWRDPAYDDASWDEIVPTGYWNSWGVKALGDFAGIVWLRKTVTLTADQAKGEAVLSLGPIDDVDTSWVNGVQVGGEDGWDIPRVYKVPAGTLHAGKNLIAVGVLALSSGGGLWGPADAKTLQFADGSKMVLDTPWRTRISAPLSETGGIPHAPWLPENGIAMLYNGMIAPLSPIGLSGIIWYQGESDTWQPEEYGRLLGGLIDDWRGKFGADLPFLVVQLPNYGAPATKPEQSDWAELRESQRHVADSVPNTGLAVTIDLGQRDNIHPTDKQAVGARLALLAEKLIYKMDIVASGPTPLAAVREGDKIRVSFANLADGLAIYEAGRPISFQLCDAKEQCRFVDATLQQNAILLDAAAMPDAASVRYCWADSPLCNVYNAAGLPAVPFELPIASATRPRK